MKKNAAEWELSDLDIMARLVERTEETADALARSRS